MKVLKIYCSSINEQFVDEAVATLRDGGIIVYPTDTLYALGCDALNNRAIERICHIKGIDPRRRNLSIVCADISQASEYVRIDNIAFRILKANFPGPFTIILPASTTLPKVFKGRKTVGLRIPDNAIAKRIASALGRPLLSTSAMDPECDGDDAAIPEAVAARYEGVADLMIDGDECATSFSTVVDLADSHNPVILRQGIGDFIG